MKIQQLALSACALASLAVSQAALAVDCNGNGIEDTNDIAGRPPIAYWRFEEQIGPFVDSGPNGLDGMATNAIGELEVPVDTIPRTTEVNTRSCDIAGNGYVTVDDPDDLLTMNGASFTVEAWVRLDELATGDESGQRQALLQKKTIGETDAGADYTILVQSGNLPPSSSTNYGKTSGFSGRELLILFGNGSTFWTVTSNLQIQTTGWHHVSIAFDGKSSEVRFGLDGQFQTIEAPGPGHTSNDGPLLIGAHTGGAGAYNQMLRGALDELRILSGAEADEQLLNSYAVADCNVNGIPDGCDVADGPSADCDGNGQPDECDLVDNDCNGNGVPDQCEPDCNENGIPDGCDISGGSSSDCQPDGIPDECQLNESYALVHDSGDSIIVYRPDDSQFMAWLNRFNVEDGAGIVEQIEVRWGIVPLLTTVNVYVWTDPNGDGNPTDAQVLWSGTTTVLQTNTLSQIAIPDIDVGDSGASFFVGFVMSVNDEMFPASLDIHGVPTPDRSWSIGWDGAFDVNDLSAGAVEFGTINDLLFGNVWFMRTQMRSDADDCNGNGLPDECDIDDGLSADLDSNGIPDECDSDCNNNGALDGFDVAGGTSLDCNADGVPDECQVWSNDCNSDGVPDDCQLAGNDCNNNLVLDACDIASGYDQDADGSGVPDECEDCNGDGMLDSIAIDLQFSDDCNNDGVPDDCQFGEAVSPMLYSVDDGVQESNLCFIGGTNLEFAWMVSHTVVPGGEWITAIEIVWGDTYPDLPAEVVLWTDPDGDGTYTDSQVIVAVDTRTMKIDSPLDNLNVVPIPPTYIGPAGTSFFVGAHFDDIWSSGCFIALDNDDPQGADQWIVYAQSGSLDVNNLSDQGHFSFYWNTSNFLVRAVGSDGALANDCNDNLTIDVCDIGSGLSDDNNGNGIPDECDDCIGDTDGNGTIDVDDLVAVILDWGTDGSGNGGDVDSSGLVDVDDLVTVILSWGPCPA